MPVSASDVSAVLVTRGDVDLGPIIDRLPFQDVIVWDNSSRGEDLGAYGRYAAISEAKHQVIYTQDDDVIVSEIPALLAAYEPGVMTINHPFRRGDPLDIPWNGKGGIFDRDLPERAFRRYLAIYPFDRYFTHEICDGVVGLLTPVKALDVGHQDLSQAHRLGRVSTSPGWYEERRPMIIDRCRRLENECAA